MLEERTTVQQPAVWPNQARSNSLSCRELDRKVSVVRDDLNTSHGLNAPAATAVPIDRRAARSLRPSVGRAGGGGAS